MSITTKQESFRRLFAGEFGNTVRTWSTPEAALQEHRGTFHLRFVCAPGARPCLWGVKPESLLRVCQETVGPYLICEDPIDNLRTIQGELLGISSAGPYVFHFSTKQYPLPKALKTDGRVVTSASSLLLLKTYLTTESYEDLMELTDRYPDHVIEFSAFSRSVGTVPGRNHIIWEVRCY